jgi:hypothetical protein
MYGSSITDEEIEILICYDSEEAILQRSECIQHRYNYPFYRHIMLAMAKKLPDAATFFIRMRQTEIKTYT